LSAAMKEPLLPTVSPSATSVIEGEDSDQGEKPLPDLSDRLREYGIYEEYLKFQHNYQKWRKGGSKGARGEANVEDFEQKKEEDPFKFTFWYPSPKKYKFFHTVSYWVGVMYLEGSFLFCIGSYAMFLGPSHELVVSAAFIIGSVVFTLATYCQVLEVVNVPDADAWVYFLPDWAGVKLRVQWDSLIGSVVYFVGAVLYGIGVGVEPFREFLSPGWVFVLIPLQSFLGGLLFFIGGLCEISHNRVLTGGSHPGQPVWWGVMASSIGGTLYFIGGIAMVFGDHWKNEHSIVHKSYMAGSALYVVSSLVLIWMWRGNEYGLTLLRQLNAAVKAGAEQGAVVDLHNTGGVTRMKVTLPEGGQGDVSPPSVEEKEQANKFSLRGVVFIVLYCWLFAATSVSCALSVGWREVSARHIVDFTSEIVWMLAVTIVLVIHSIITSVPNEQPYRCAMLGMRFTLLLGAITQTVLLVSSIRNPRRPFAS